MQIPLQITSHDFTLSEAIETEIREKAAKLETYYDDIVRCRVTIEAPVSHHRQGGPFKVRLDLTVPGTELVVNHQASEDLRIVIRDAFDAMRRQLEDYARHQRGEVKKHELASRARISKILREEGYGFLETPDGREIYFHANSVLSPGFPHLAVGTEVRFSEEQGAKGPQASTVTILKRSST